MTAKQSSVVMTPTFYTSGLRYFRLHYIIPLKILFFYQSYRSLTSQ